MQWSAGGMSGILKSTSFKAPHLRATRLFITSPQRRELLVCKDAHMRPRENARLAAAIQHAIVIDAVEGAAHAWAYLSTHAVSQATILRVLSGDGARRASDVKVAHQAQADGQK
jgi:hypothetical protein